MELGLFDQVSDIVAAMCPEDLGTPRSRAHRRGVKVWFGDERPPREHYEAQLIGRRHVDGVDGMALEIGFHAEHPKVAENEATMARLQASEQGWRSQLGAEAEAGAFFGAENWRRLSEAWIEPDLDDPELVFEIASRLVDYVAAVEPILAGG